MGQSLSNLLTHIIFSTKNRHALIHTDIESRLYGYIRSVCQEFESPLIQIGGMTDHIHILVNLSRKQALSKFVNEIKSHSSKWIKTIDNNFLDFCLARWLRRLFCWTTRESESNKLYLKSKRAP